MKLTRKSIDWVFQAPKRPRIGMQVLILTNAAAKTLGELWGVTLEPGIYEYRGKKLGFVQTSKLWDRLRMLAMKPKGRQHTWGPAPWVHGLHCLRRVSQVRREEQALQGEGQVEEDGETQCHLIRSSQHKSS